MLTSFLASFYSDFGSVTGFYNMTTSQTPFPSQKASSETRDLNWN